MPRSQTSAVADGSPPVESRREEAVASHPSLWPNALVHSGVIYCGDNLEQFKKLPGRRVDLIYIDPPFNSNRNYEVFWGETKGKGSFKERHESTKEHIGQMRI